MALTVIKPSGIETSGNYTVNGMNVSANMSVANLSVTNSLTLLTTSANLGDVGNVIITGGTNGYVLQTNGSGNLSWVAQSGGSTSNISNGNSNVNIPSANGNINFSAVGNTVMVITGTGVNVAGTLNTGSGVITGNGNGLSSLVGANVTGQVGNSLIAGTVYTNAQPNITSVGTLTDLSVSGNGVFGGNLTVNGTLTYINSTTLSISDPIINLQTGPNGAAPVANTGKDVGTALNYYDTSAKIAWMGWDISNAEIAFGSNVGISSEVVTFTELANIRSGNAQLGNNVTANYFTGNGSLLTGITTTSISNGNSNVNIPTANGNINLTAVGNTVMVITGTGANISGTANVTGNLVAGNITAGSGTGGNITGGNVISANTFTASGNITAGNANLGNAVSANFFIGSGNNLSNISGSNVTGQVGNALVSGTVYTNAQPNITSVGSLTGLTVSNATGIVDFTTTANVTLGAVANVHISGGTNAYVLSTDGAGNLSWVAQSGGGGGANISNGNSNVNIPVADGNINFSATGNANVMTITGTGANISGYANITGNIALSGADVSLGNVSNLHITGGSNTFVLSTDGAGNLSWAAASGTSIGVDNFTGNGVQTAYTLTTTPANANATLVSIAGTFQPRTVYSLTGNVITFSSAPPNTAPIEVTTFTAGSGGGGGGITAQDLLSPFLLMGA